MNRSTPDRPKVEGSVAVRDGRRLSFAEYGVPGAPAIIWMHGTPGGRRQVPIEAREYAEEIGIRIIGVDRPGIGSSTPHLYDNVLDWTGDLEILADTLGVGTMRLIGLSGGGPYVLAAGAALPDRVEGIGVLGGVAPTKGPHAIGGGLVEVAPYAAPVLYATRVPLGFVLSRVFKLARPVASLALDGYRVLQPAGDRTLLARPEFKAMFLDDLLNGSRFQVSAPLADVILFTRDWGFTPDQVKVPVRWWHGDADHIIPFAHGEHMVRLLPHAQLTTIDGESHLGGLGVAVSVIDDLLSLGTD
ncbi:MAG: alpha/beta hydrolase [Myxococcales bacterium]|nr:MAG: alpha/beta hydrolase [Myxococcales bacterium]